MSIALELSLRLLGAALLGAAIGYEREMRGKGAGLRTHMLVALGSALFMTISIYGFPDANRFDASRVAAGVVGGLGFLCAGIIMKNRHISGLTTAAGLWVTGAVGLGMGGGMYEMSILCTFLMILCLEVMHFLIPSMGDRQITATLSAADDKVLRAAIESLGKQVVWFAILREGELVKAEINLRTNKKESPLALLERLSAMPGIRVEIME
ncbi:MAG: MgtC/SapB family protein [Bacteroidales bacterium]|nr:MgtC/SapB family protein [Bacteroidales bacterium]